MNIDQPPNGLSKYDHSVILEAAIQTTPDAIFIKDTQGHYFLINDAGARLIGRPVADILGKTDHDLLEPAQAEQVTADDQVVLASDRTQTFEDVITSQGATRIYHTLKVPYKEPNGKTVGIIGISRDITKLKQAELSQRLLAEAGKMLATSLDYSVRLKQVAQLAVPHLADWCSLDVVGNDKILHNLAIVHAEPDKLSLAQELQQRYTFQWHFGSTVTNVLKTGQSKLYPVVTEEHLRHVAQNEAHFEQLRQFNFISAMIVPLIARGDVLGTMSFFWAESQRHYSPYDLSLAEELARRAGTALDNARLYEAEQTARTEAELAQEHLAMLAEERERNRLAQELHDTVAQALGYIKLKLTMTNTLLAEHNTDQVAANLQELKQIVSETYTDVREEIFHLRSNMSPDYTFLALLNKYIGRYKSFYNLDIGLVLKATPEAFEFSGRHSFQVIRTIQEALINVRKHANVKKALITLARQDNRVTVIIEDNGEGFDVAQIQEQGNQNFGLEIMQERIESVGGILEISSTPGKGTRILLSVLLDETAEEHS